MSKSNTLKMQKRMDIWISTTTAFLVFLSIIGIFVSGLWVFLKYNPAAGPETHITTYANTITDENGEQRYLMELEYWENKNNEGFEVAEFSFNAYSGMDRKAVIQKGVQWHNNTKKQSGLSGLMYDLMNKSAGNVGNVGIWNTNYYDKDGAASWKSISTIDVGTPMYIEVDGELYEMLMNGTYTTHTRQFNFVKSVKNVFRGFFGKANYKEESTWYDYLPVVNNYTMNNFYNDMLNSLTATNVGYGENICSLVDLSKYFEIRKFNTKTKQFDDLTEGHDIQKSYFSVKVNKHAEGFRRATDSSFKIFNNDPEFTLVSTDGYFEDYTNIKLPEKVLGPKDFDYFYLGSIGGYVAQLKDEVIASFIKNELAVIAINVNDAFFGVNKNIKGLHVDKLNYQYLQSVTINLSEESAVDFYILDNCSKIEFERIKTVINITNTKSGVVTKIHGGVI